MKLELSDITKKYGSKTAIDGFSCVFDMRPGARLAVCGPSGCGKSTLLSIIAGLDTDYAGTLAFTGGGEARISMSMQAPTLLPWLTAAENVNLVAGDRRRGLEDARTILRELGLAGHENDHPDELSGGMQTAFPLHAHLRAMPICIFLMSRLPRLTQTPPGFAST